jgi:hypothetical protein
MSRARKRGLSLSRSPPHIFSSSYGTFHSEFTVITCRAAALPAYVRLRWPARGQPPKGESI